jgi:CheY-like chemotaxis protein
MKPVNLLLVEDNEGDIILTIEAFEEAKIVNNISVARDGEQAIKLLENCATETPESLPDIILLDINMPKVNGHEVLHFVKNHEKLRHIPVIILTTSSSETDIHNSYSNYANCYITKPVDIEDFMAVVSRVESFWISLVQLPRS